MLDIKSFFNLYRESKSKPSIEDEFLARQNIIITKHEVFTVNSPEQLVELTKLHAQKALERMIIQFVTAMLEFPDDTFHIKGKSTVVTNAFPFNDSDIEVRMSIQLIILNPSQFKEI